MDFRDSPEQAAFRKEVTAWMDEALRDLPGDPDTRDQREREEQSRWWQATIHHDGWAGLSWPEAYGGRGLSVVEDAIFYEESARRRAPMPVNMLGMLLAGPTIMVHGTEAQKSRYLPQILSGEEVWCQGFSEPGSGSDLASLSTRADHVDGGFRVTGQKVWTSSGHLADKCMLLTRTSTDGPKHHGITYLLADMDEVDVRPLVMINRDAEFNEMFLQDVFVPDDDVLGDVDSGWRVAVTTLSFERGGLSLSLQVWARQAIDDLVALARTLGVANDSAFVEQLGRFEADALALRIGSVRTMSVVSAGGQPGPETSVFKLLWAHTVQEVRRYGLELLAERGHQADDDLTHPWLHSYLRSRGHTIEGGTDEVQLSIIAERVLDLPRSR